MEINADFTAPAFMHAARLPWIPSPTPGVERRMLDRLGGEVARATSIVRYAPGSRFPVHVHGGGEEFLVLEGVFSDETGDMPAGTYVRNPPGTSHAPASADGCTILVKLWQFDPADSTPVRLNTAALELEQVASRLGVLAAVLHRNENEEVRIERWAGRAMIDLALPGGGELLVMEGSFEKGGDIFEPLSWLRLPSGSALVAAAGPDGCRVWIRRDTWLGPFVSLQASDGSGSAPGRA
jgi:quercetin dioxygenase-like cupin family protein